MTDRCDPWLPLNDAPFVCYGGDAHCFCVFDAQNHSVPKHERDGGIVIDHYQMHCCRCSYVAMFRVTLERKA